MKKLLLTCSLVLIGVTSSSFAETVTGELVDVNCYVDHGAKGEKHQKCAEGCINKGLPVGILTSEGKLVLLVGSHHEPINTKVASLAAKQVTAEGKMVERNGVSLLEAEKVEAAK